MPRAFVAGRASVSSCDLLAIGRAPLVRAPAALLTALSLAGCAAPYPKDWAALPSAGDPCPDISGAFVEKGDPYGTLGAWLVPEALQGHAGHHVVIARLDNGDIEVTAWRERLRLEGDTTVRYLEAAGARTFRSSQGDFRCRDGSIAFASSGMHCVIPLEEWVSCERQSLTFRKSEDGALVAGVSTTTIEAPFILLPIPLAGGGSDWARFMPYVPEGTERQQAGVAGQASEAVPGGGRR